MVFVRPGQVLVVGHGKTAGPGSRRVVRVLCGHRYLDGRSGQSGGRRCVFGAGPTCESPTSPVFGTLVRRYISSNSMGDILEME